MIFNDRPLKYSNKITGVAVAALALAVAATGWAGKAWAADSEAARGAFKTAIAYERAQNLRDAHNAMANAIEADPDWPDARLAQARILVAMGNGIGAEAEIRRARELGLSDTATRVQLAHAVWLQGEPARALAELQAGPVPDRYKAYAERIAGNAAMDLGNFDGARAAFDESIRLDPDNSQLWADISRFRYTNADVGGAMQAIDRALQLNRNNMDATLIKAGLVRENQGLIPALGWYERVLKVKPDHVGALVEYAATLGDVGRSTDMLKATRRVLAIDKNNARARLLQAILAARAENYDLAQRILFKIGDQLENLPAFLLVSAVVEEELGNHNVAVNRATKLLDLQPNNFTARRILALASLNAGDADDAWHIIAPIYTRPDADSWSIMLAASALEEEGDIGEAVPLLMRASQFRKGDAIAFAPATAPELLAADAARNPLNAQLVIPYIRSEVNSGRIGSALAAAQRLQRANPGVPDAHMLVGDTELAGKRAAAAVTAYQQAVRLRFGEVGALRLANAHSESGNDAAALHTLGDFTSRNPENIPATRILGSLYLKNNDWNRAVAALEMVRARTGNRDALLMNELGSAWQGKGNLAKATTYFRHAYAIQPANAAITNNLGWALHRLSGPSRTSLDLLEKAVILAPDNGTYRQRFDQARAANQKG